MDDTWETPPEGGCRYWAFLLLAALGGSVAMIVWVLGLEPGNDLATLQGTAMLMGAIMLSAEAAGRLLYGERIAKQVVTTLWWRVALCEGLAGAGLWFGAAASNDAAWGSVILGAVLILSAARATWLRLQSR